MMKLWMSVFLLLILSQAIMCSEVDKYDKTVKQNNENMEMDTIRLSVKGRMFTVVLEKNSSAEALLELLEKGDMSVEMEDYARMEKVGSLGVRLPRNDKPTSTGPGDLILYQGHYLVIYYDHNSYSFTPMGKITNVTQEELKEVLGNGNVTVTLSSRK